jgi:hypothetical protein
LRFTVRRPPYGEVSLCWHRPSGGDVVGRVNVGVARPCIAGDAREDRLALAVFGCDVPTGGAPLRRVSGQDSFDSVRSLILKPRHQPTPALTTDRAVETPLLRNPNTGSINRASSGARHRPYIEILNPDCVEPARKVGGGLFEPVSSPVRFARFESRNRQLRPLPAVGAVLGARETLLQAVQPNLLRTCELRSAQQLTSGQRRRYHHTAVHTDDAVIARSGNRIRNVRECNMPAPGAIPGNAVGLHIQRYGSRPAKSDPTDLAHPHPSVAPVELCDVLRLDADLPEALMNTRLAKCRTAVSTGKEVSHGLCEIPERLLLHRVRPSRQPVIFEADLGQLRRLLVVSRGMAARLPQLLLLNGQIPHEPGMPTMLQQLDLLSQRWRQPKPRHAQKVASATDICGCRTPNRHPAAA